MRQCPSCQSDDLVQIALKPSGEALLFSTCRACEHRWWEDTSQSHTVPLREVLEHVSAA